MFIEKQKNSELDRFGYDEKGFYDINRNYNQHSDCMHDNCENCHGRGYREDGRPCVHMISCPCKKCSNIMC